MEYVWVEVSKKMEEIELEASKILMGTPIDDVPLIQLHIMAELFATDKQHPSTLARNCGRAPTSFTPILDKVEKRGWIKREADPCDHRAIFICVATDGWLLRGPIENAISALNAVFGYEQILSKAESATG